MSKPTVNVVHTQGGITYILCNDGSVWNKVNGHWVEVEKLLGELKDE